MVKEEKMKKFTTMILTALMIIGIAACGSDSSSSSSSSDSASTTDSSTDSSEDSSADASEAAAGGIFYSVEANPYASLDAHKDYYSWHTQFYGITETLFRIADDMSIEPWLAESYETEGTSTTITLKDGVCFSNGEPLTADMVKRNLERLAEVNTRFAYVADWDIEAVDDSTLVITTEELYTLLINDLATAEFAMLDLDNTTDYDNAPIGTGPFAVETFVADGDITVTKNENYWDGEVLLDGAVFYAMSDEESKLLAMQNGEIDGYVDISSASKEIYEMSPDMYTVTTVDTERRAYALINSASVSDNVREALVLGLDKSLIETYTSGILSYTDGFFSTGTYYGGVQSPEYDPDAAMAALEADGYTMNDSTGYYEKDGETLTLTISTYSSRSLDTLAILMQEQYKAIGINIEIAIEDNPDSTYISTMDFDIGMYTSITDTTGHPFTFLNQIKSGAWLDVCGFGNEETDALIEELRYTTDEARQTELADEIMTQLYDSNCYLAIGQYTKSTVIRTGAGGLGETSPMSFYGISASSYAN